MKLISFRHWVKVESTNTNNCHHRYEYHTIYLNMFRFTWKAIEWNKTIISLHKDNEAIRYK